MDHPMDDQTHGNPHVHMKIYRRSGYEKHRLIFFHQWVVPEKIRTPRRMGFWKSSREGGSKTLEIQAGGGVKLEKVFCRGHFDR